MPLRVAIIGCGDIAGGYDERKQGEGIFSHAGAYRSENDIELVCAFDTDLERLTAFCSYWNIPGTCHDFEELFRGRYDMVSLCTPDPTHYPIMKRLIEEGCTRYIWTEKPFTTEVLEAKSILSAAKERRIGLWLSNQRRWEPGHIRARAYITEGNIGQVVHANAYYVKGITHIGCTAVDTVRFLCGEISWVMAYPPFNVGSYDDDYSLSGILGIEKGGTVNVVGCDSAGYSYSIFEIDILGTKGRVRIEENGDEISFFASKEYGHYPGFMELKLVEKFETEMKWSMRYGLQLMLGDMRKGLYSTELAEEGYRDLLVTEAIKRSAYRGGNRVELEK